MKKDAEISKHNEFEMEMNMLQSNTRRETMDLKQAIKEKEIRSVACSFLQPKV